MKKLDLFVQAEFGWFTFVPLSNSNWFRVVFNDGVEAFGKRYSYGTMEVQLDQDTHLWKVQSTYGDFTPAARKFLVPLVENWANTWANEPKYRNVRVARDKEFKRVDLSTAQRHLAIAEQALREAQNRVMVAVTDVTDTVYCPTCGGAILHEFQKNIWQDPEDPRCPYCGVLLPLETVEAIAENNILG